MVTVHMGRWIAYQLFRYTMSFVRCINFPSANSGINALGLSLTRSYFSERRPIDVR